MWLASEKMFRSWDRHKPITLPKVRFLEGCLEDDPEDRRQVSSEGGASSERT